jgi:hypothetical protein
MNVTFDGSKPIEQIQVGDRVLAKNDRTGSVDYKTVIWTFHHDVEELYLVTVGGHVIETTNNHPFWVSGKGWMHAEDMQVGDLLEKADGFTLKIEKIEVVEKHATVYNFTVAEHHTYFVSDLGIWVHNTGGECNVYNKYSPNDLRNVSNDILDRSEKTKKGHLIEKHVSMSNEYLINRAHSEGVPATSFNNKSTALKAVQENIRKNAESITEWLNNPNSRNDFKSPCDHLFEIGYGVSIKNQGNAASKQVQYGIKKSMLYLAKDPSMPEGFKIVTGYPIFD